MKRSDAFKKLYEFACDAEKDGWLDNPMAVAENFLSFVEFDLGMHPPKNEGTILYKDDDEGRCGDVYYFNWEEEKN